jgi:chromosome segregation ATPase
VKPSSEPLEHLNVEAEASLKDLTDSLFRTPLKEQVDPLLQRQGDVERGLIETKEGLVELRRQQTEARRSLDALVSKVNDMVTTVQGTGSALGTVTEKLGSLESTIAQHKEGLDGRFTTLDASIVKFDRAARAEAETLLRLIQASVSEQKILQQEEIRDFLAESQRTRELIETAHREVQVLTGHAQLSIRLQEDMPKALGSLRKEHEEFANAQVEAIGKVSQDVMRQLTMVLEKIELERAFQAKVRRAGYLFLMFLAAGILLAAGIVIVWSRLHR